VTTAPSDVYGDPEVLQGLRLYSDLAKKRVREISAKTEELYRLVPSFAPLLRGLSGEAMVEQNAENIERIRAAAYEGSWEPYLANLKARGTAYARHGVRLEDWTEVFQRLLAWVMDLVVDDAGGDQARLRAMLKGTSCLFDTVVQVIGQTFVEEHGAIIRHQQAALRELSTPVLAVGERVLLVPLIGDLDEGRISHLRSALLDAIRANRAKVVVLDVTGVAHVDTAVAHRLGAVIKAARLMGARVLVSGLSSEISQAMVLLGTDLPGAETFTTLQLALADAGGAPDVQDRRAAQDR